MMTLKQAKSIAGSLGNPSKMPGKSYGLPAADAKWLPSLAAERGVMVPPAYGCPVGSLMAKIKGTTCSACYANDKNNYAYGSVKVAQLNRAVGIYHPQWTEAMIRLISHYCEVPEFRWHDSGDLVGLWHLLKIIEIAEALPHMTFWLPTREAKLIASLNRPLPSNLIVRVSAIKVGSGPSKAFAHTSTVDHEEGWQCPAQSQGNACGGCRACWDPEIDNVNYPLH